MWLKFLLIFLLIFAYKLITSIADLVNIRKYYNLYVKYLSEQDTEIHKYKSLCVDLFKRLHIEDVYMPISQKTGYGMVASYNSSLFTNFPSNTNIFAPDTMRIFRNAIGLCENNIKQCFNPLYWIRCIIFLPKNILLYLNVSADSIFIKIFQLIYWLTGIIATIFSEDIANYLKSFIHF